MEVFNSASELALPSLVVTKASLMAIPILPLLGAALLGLFVIFGFKKDFSKSHWQSGWVATLFSFGAFIATCLLFRDLVDGIEAVSFKAWTWFEVGHLRVDFALRMDRLAGIMTLVVTGIGTLIHLYAIGYMDHDSDRPRFFCYLNLFLFSMLMLVLGDNLLLMFVGWEGVGLCSYLLIGFWFKEMPNAKAGQKAFVVNRIGDAGFLLGIFLLFWSLGTVNFLEIQAAVGGIPAYTLELIALALFVGAVGKSAQIPLYIWLPDAMAGPTPVSALIHAATMVTAGIYMITKMSFLYASAPIALSVILVIGTITAFLAATIALVQNDIKKVLAYSTVSQLGYMFMALGAGAFSNGIYHVVTHAFFKACLFMAAGSVIVGCHHEQDMRKFGGLRKSMKFTFIAYLCATYAIAGLPYGSGFFSKDGILWAVFSSDGLLSQNTLFGRPITHVLWALGVITALLTAFYMTRSLMKTFFGEYRGDHPAHETSWPMVVPILVLAVPSLFFGLVYGETMMHFLEQWGRADLNVGHDVLAANPTYHAVEQVSMVVAIVGVVVAFLIYGIMPTTASGFAAKFPLVHRFLYNKWYVDEVYAALIIRPLQFGSKLLFSIVDRSLIDGSVNGTGAFVVANGEMARRFHTGRIELYAVVMFLSCLFGILFWILI